MDALVWVIGIIIALAVFFDYLGKNPDAAALVLICAVSAAGYYVYKLIVGSNLFKSYVSKLDAETRAKHEKDARQQSEAEAVARQAAHDASWETYTFPPPAQFEVELEALTPKHSAMYLPRFIIAQLFNTVVIERTTFTPEDAQRIYDSFLTSSAQALRSYLDRLPEPYRLELKPSLFTTTYVPTIAEMRPAYQALGTAFRGSSLIQATPGPWLPPMPTMRPYDRSDRKDHDRAEKEYEKEYKQWEKERDQIYEDLPAIEKEFLGTSFFSHAHVFEPEPVQIPFEIPEDKRFAGTWIVAPSGRGKTNLLHHMVQQDRPNGTVVLLDSKGDLINAYRGLPEVVVIDPATANINPLQLGSSTRSVEFLEYIFSVLLDTSMTPLQKTLFRAVLTILMRKSDATIETFRQVLTTGWQSAGLEEYIRQCDPATQDFFLAPKPAFSNNTYAETKNQILWRLQLILSNDYLRNIFTSATTNVPFTELLDSRKTIIIDNSKDELGEDGAEFFGRFFVALVWMAAVSRSRLKPEDKIPVYFYIDECHTVVKRDDKIATILDECRSQKIALILAHQRIAQIISANVIDAMGNCAVRIANSDDDAAQLAPRFRVDPQTLRQPQGHFACFVRDKTPVAKVVSVDLFDLSVFPPPPPKQPAPPAAPRAASAPQKPKGPTLTIVPKAGEIEDF